MKTAEQSVEARYRRTRLHKPGLALASICLLATAACESNDSSSGKGVNVTEDPVIRSSMISRFTPSDVLQGVLTLHHGNCLEIDDRIPVFEPGVVWEPGAQEVIYNGGAFTVGQELDATGAYIPIDSDLHSVIGDRAVAKVEDCATQLDDDEIVIVYSLSPTDPQPTIPM
jgi:hypothetical protein